MNLGHKGISTQGTCQICGKAPETIHLALLPGILSIRYGSFGLRKPKSPFTVYWSFLDSSLHLISEGCLGALESFLATAWAIWFNRNQILHDELGSHPRQILELGRNMLAKYKAATTSDPSPQTSPQSWLKPPKGHFKINVDGASANDGCHSCIRVIIKDDKGHPVAALSKILQSHFFAEVTKMLALEQGVLLAQEMELS